MLGRDAEKKRKRVLGEVAAQDGNMSEMTAQVFQR